MAYVTVPEPPVEAPQFSVVPVLVVFEAARFDGAVNGLGPVEEAGQVNVATALAGRLYVKYWPFSSTLNVCALEVSAFRTTRAVEPSGLRKATSSMLPEPNVFESIRTAPGLTNLLAWPST